ncbi:Cupredoxin [Pholiota molesta]|nr:Cupredoxin [Pholiota molesta]
MISSPLNLLLVALPTVLGATFDVQVGAGGQLAYNPEFITANPGDIVNFIFVPVAAGTTNLPTKQFTVPEGTAPLWFYCEQTGHCGQGMVFAINAPADPAPNSFTAFKAAAIAQNGTAASATSTTAASSTVAAVTTDPNFTTPPAPQWTSATATVSLSNTVYTTTYSSYLGTPPPTPAPVPVDHRIIVGANGNLVYSPANITAAIGDTVTFEFHPKNHTVTQSSFLKPCQSLQETSGTAGFKSGFMPVDASATTFPTFQITINDTAPIWGYCGQVGHCAAGMVFAINAVESGPNNFESFQQLALHSNSSAAATTAATAPTGTPTSAAVKWMAGCQLLTFFETGDTLTGCSTK